MSNKKVTLKLGVYLNIEFSESLIQTNAWYENNTALRIET
jgi:hypothetical protein